MNLTSGLVDFLLEVSRHLFPLWVGGMVLSTLLIGLALLIGRRLRYHGPAMTSFLYKATLSGVVLGTLLLFGGSRYLPSFWTLPLLSEAQSRSQLEPVETAFIPITPQVVEREQTGSRRETYKPSFSSLPVPSFHPERKIAFSLTPPRKLSRLDVWMLGVVGVWGVGGMFLLGGIVYCHFYVRRLRRQCSLVTQGEAVEVLRELCLVSSLPTPQLLVSPALSSPFLTGLRHPAIVLPASYTTDFDFSTLRAVLLHETTHLRQRDCLWTMIARTLSALLWTQPLLWVLCRQMEQANEEVCDEAVVAHGESPQAYARCLLALAERFHRPIPTLQTTSTGVVSSRSSVGRRIERIMDTSRTQTQPLNRHFRIFAVSGVLTLSILGAILLNARAQQEPESQALKLQAEAIARQQKAAKEQEQEALKEDAKVMAKAQAAQELVLKLALNQRESALPAGKHARQQALQAKMLQLKADAARQGLQLKFTTVQERKLAKSGKSKSLTQQLQAKQALQALQQAQAKSLDDFLLSQSRLEARSADLKKLMDQEKHLSKSYPSANEIQSEVRLKVFTLKLQTLTEELTELQLTEEGESNPKVEKLQKMVDKVRALIEKEQYSLQYLQKK